MNRLLNGLVFMSAAFATSAVAQTVTGSGSTNTVPVFTGTSTVGNSPISVSGSVVSMTAATNPAIFIFDGSAYAGYFGIASTAGAWSNSASAGDTVIRSSTNNVTIAARNASGGIVFSTGAADTTKMFVANSGNVGIGTISPGSNLDVVANPTGTVPQVRISPIGNTGSSTSIPSYLDFYSTFDAYPTDQAPRRTATIKARFSGGVWGNEALTFEVGTGGTNDAGNEPTERMRIAGSGNVGIGTTSPGAKLEVDGSVKLTSGSGATLTFQDGTVQSTAFTGVLCGGDYAESVDVTGTRTSYEPGDLLVIDPNHPGRFLKSAEPYSTLVAGIYSTKPGAVGRRQAIAKSPNEVPMAMIGIVPTKASTENGPVKVGDLLVTSSTPGYAMKGTDRDRMLGAVIGKALGSLDSGTGIIEAVVTLQ